MSVAFPFTILGIVSLGLLSCRGDETVTAYGAADIEWRLYELDGQPFMAQATLAFPEPGQITGSAPCNRFSGTMDAPYPWFDAQELSLTRMACKNLKDERIYIAALQDMTLSEVSGEFLILSNVEGREMLFKAAD